MRPLVILSILVSAFVFMSPALHEGRALLTDGLNGRAPASTPRKTAVTPAAGCRLFYDKLYAASTVKVRMIFGYKDARPARFVGDRHERVAFIQRLTAACKTGQACGFVRSPENADLFAKDIQLESGRKVRFLVWVVNSSVGSDDQENRKDPFQKWKSGYAQAAFDSGLKDADVIFYNGHSRFGGGPDFAPPHLDQNDEVDPRYYKTVKPGLHRLNEALQTAKNEDGANSQLKMLGLFSCSSDQHFAQDIHKYSNAKLLASRNLVYYSDALETSLFQLSNVLERKCL